VRREDFSDSFDTLKINQQISYHSMEEVDPKSDASARVLPIPPRLQALLCEHWSSYCQGDDSAPSGLLFATDSGKPTAPRNFEHLWAGYTSRRKRANGPVLVKYPGIRDMAQLPAGTTLHDLRRFVATTLEDLETGQRTIGHILGHTAGNVTELYIKRNLPTLRRALEKLEDALWSPDIEVKPFEPDQAAANYHSKLTDEQVREMRALWNNGDGLSHVEIGRRYGVSNVAAKNAIDSDRGR
jgi:integrase